MNIGDRSAYIAMAHLVEPGNREVGCLIRASGPTATLSRLLAGTVSRRLSDAVATRLRARELPRALSAGQTLADEAEARADRLGAQLVTPADDGWPHRLDDLDRISDTTGEPKDRDTDRPLCIWTRGILTLTEALDRSVSIVGARACTAYGSQVAADLAYGLADREWCIVSGGAFGIDAMAHRAALAAGGTTIVVLACGIDRPYPVSHASLFERVTEEGLLISEWPPGAAPHRTRFLVRNRVIAAATRGTVLVEAANRSGARQTLGRARLLDRPAMAVPGPITSAMSAGCHAELRVPGTRPVSTVDEVLEEIGPIGTFAPETRGPDRPYDLLDPIAARLLDAVLPRRARTAEEIAAVAGVSGRDARRALPALEIGGFVVQDRGRYRLARRARPAGRAAGPGAAELGVVGPGAAALGAASPGAAGPSAAAGPGAAA